MTQHSYYGIGGFMGISNFFERSDSIANLSQAILSVQKSVLIAHRDATNPHFRSKYATLDEVLSVLRGPLGEAGLCFSQHPLPDNSLLTSVMHRSGEYLMSIMSLPNDQASNAQKAGSCITYMRRYALVSIFGIAQEDDDGNAASDKPKTNSTKPIKKESPSGFDPTNKEHLEGLKRLFIDPSGFSILDEAHLNYLAKHCVGMTNNQIMNYAIKEFGLSS